MTALIPAEHPTSGKTAGSPLVSIEAVTKRFGVGSGTPRGFTAVDRVSLTFAEGEFFSLLGPSGCGKTTLLRMLAGFESPDEGAIRIAGRDVTADPPHRRPVNLVFQHYALFPHLSVAKNVAFGLRYQRIHGTEARRRVDQALDQVQLAGLGGRKPGQLSGGQRQRVALARALVLRPKVLLLDEPLGALDQKLRREMQIELKQLQRSLGITFVFVTHDQEEALTMSDRIAVMNAGRVEQAGAAVEVFERPTTEFVARFMGASNFFTKEREGRACRFLVRPEKLVICAVGAEPPGLSSKAVVIRQRVYQGLSTIWTVESPAGEVFTVYRQNAEPYGQAETMAEGAAASLCWNPDHCVEIGTSEPSIVSPAGPGSGVASDPEAFDPQRDTGFQPV